MREKPYGRSIYEWITSAGSIVKEVFPCIFPSYREFSAGKGSLSTGSSASLSEANPPFSGETEKGALIPAILAETNLAKPRHHGAANVTGAAGVFFSTVRLRGLRFNANCKNNLKYFRYASKPKSHAQDANFDISVYFYNSH